MNMFLLPVYRMPRPHPQSECLKKIHESRDGDDKSILGITRNWMSRKAKVSSATKIKGLLKKKNNN